MSSSPLPEFPLYQAPLTLPPGRCTVCEQEKPHCLFVSHLLAPCRLCGTIRAFNVQDAGEVTRCESCDRLDNWPEQWPRERTDIRVCYDCLRAGKAGVTHRTELGLVSPPYVLRGMTQFGDEPAAQKHGLKTTVLEIYSDGSSNLGVHVPQEMLDELVRTPIHPSLQDEYWPFHCGGWMQYLGKWQPEDFERRAPGNSIAWLAQHIDDPEMAEEYMGWLASDMAWSCIYACPRCGLHKVWVDAD